MIKAVKKLKKLWPRKKKRKRTHQYQEPYYHHPPSPCHCCCSYPAAPTQPSAPPLPPWLEPDELTYEAISAPGLQSLPDLAHPGQILVPSQEIVIETSPIYPTLPSYQQYLVPNPVYGVPVEQKTRREESTGFFGCVVNFCASLISCFCPCFRIQEKSEIVVA